MLSFASGAPTSTGASQAISRATPDQSDDAASSSEASKPLTSAEKSADTQHLLATPRRRLGASMGVHHQSPNQIMPVRSPQPKKSKTIVESAYPVFWLEVLDEAHQKWICVDPLVTHTFAKPAALEPPGSDRLNSMVYVVAFEDDGVARDVTRRYCKAYNAKTRKQRIDSSEEGVRWWQQALSRYQRRWENDVDQIEVAELAAAEAREPMPRNITDFKDHPVYALERHLKRNEVLVDAQEVGKIAAGRDAKAKGGKKMEAVFRRRNVAIARSSDAWYRKGRDVKPAELPVKFIKARISGDDAEFDAPRADLPLFTESQTELYVPPPVINGRVPKNSFGNLDIYVPSMVPPGGVHINGKHTFIDPSILYHGAHHLTEPQMSMPLEQLDY